MKESNDRHRLQIIIHVKGRFKGQCNANYILWS
jgi:hypothetical protein